MPEFKSQTFPAEQILAVSMAIAVVFVALLQGAGIFSSQDFSNLPPDLDPHSYPAQLLQKTGSDFATLNAREQEVISYLDSYTTKNRENLFLYYDDGERTLAYSEDEQVRSASLIKITVMMEVFRQLEAGSLTKSSRVSRYGFSGTVEQALKEMMQQSSNAATGALLQAAGGPEQVNELIQSLLGEETKTIVYHTPGIYSETQSSLDNMTTAREQVQLMQLLNEGKVVSPEASVEMLQLMSGTRDYFGVKTINNLGSIAMKTGYFPNFLFGLTGTVQNSAGSYSFCIIVEDWSRGNASWAGIKALLQQLNSYSLISE